MIKVPGMETNQSINQPSSEEPEIEMVFFLALSSIVI
jgi:hypothetical protein